MDLDETKNVNSESIKLSLDTAFQYTEVACNQNFARINQAGLRSNFKTSAGEDAKNILISDDQLSQMFGKGDFCKLNVVGQFNKGFILCTLNQNQDLFILDQHACDEKFNFETFSRTTVLHTQDLINPIRVQLSITDALAVNLHKEVFHFNGFKVKSAAEENPDQEGDN